MTATLAPPLPMIEEKKSLLVSKKAPPISPPNPIPRVEETTPKHASADRTLDDLFSEEAEEADFTRDWRAGLPTFPWEEGHRIVIDPVTGKSSEVPLTLYDILYESEEEIGAVFMSQGADHAIVGRILAVMLQTYLAVRGWLILNDVYVRWGPPGMKPKGPDIVAIAGGRMPPKGKNSFVVGRDGPLPSFVIEITSEKTRDEDLVTKKSFYASMGVAEYLIIDRLPEDEGDWQLIGYHLADEPFYTKLTPEADGSLSFATVRLRFQIVEHTSVKVYDADTGELLLTPDEIKEMAKQEAEERAKAEARAESEAARADAEAKARIEERMHFEARIRELEAQLARQQT